MALLNIVFLTVLFASAIATVTHITQCEESVAEVCRVSEARITPCIHAKKCKLHKGSNVTIEFDFKPAFRAENLKTTVYWVAAGGDVPFANFGSDNACLYTACPTEADKMQTLMYTVHVNKKWPQGVFPLRWKIWNDINTQELCCFRLSIEIRK